VEIFASYIFEEQEEKNENMRGLKRVLRYSCGRFRVRDDGGEAKFNSGEF